MKRRRRRFEKSRRRKRRERRGGGGFASKAGVRRVLFREEGVGGVLAF